MTITDFFIDGQSTIESIAKLFKAPINDVAYWYQVFDNALLNDYVNDELFEAICEKIDMRFDTI